MFDWLGVFIINIFFTDRKFDRLKSTYPWPIHNQMNKLQLLILAVLLAHVTAFSIDGMALKHLSLDQTNL